MDGLWDTAIILIFFYLVSLIVGLRFGGVRFWPARPLPAPLREDPPKEFDGVQEPQRKDSGDINIQENWILMGTLGCLLGILVAGCGGALIIVLVRIAGKEPSLEGFLYFLFATMITGFVAGFSIALTYK